MLRLAVLRVGGDTDDVVANDLICRCYRYRTNYLHSHICLVNGTFEAYCYKL